MFDGEGRLNDILKLIPGDDRSYSFGHLEYTKQPLKTVARLHFQ